MKNKHITQLLTLSTFGVLCLTSCGHRSYTHNTLNSDLAIYSADLNHNGILEDHPVKVGSKIYRKEKNVTWAESYDVLMSQISDNELLNYAADNMGIAKKEPKRAQLARYEILHQAEELLMSTGSTMPLYNYSDPFLIKQNVDGIYSMGLGTKYLDQLLKNNKDNQEFHLSVGTKADTLDPADNNDSSTSNMLNNCLRGLSYYVKDDNQPEESQSRTYGSTLEWNKVLLENDPTIEYDSNNKPTYTFKLRSDNKQWSNGENVTALDFVYTWHRACSGYHGTWSFVFDCIEGYNDYAKLDTDKQKFWKDDPTKDTDPDGYIKGITLYPDDEYKFSVKLTYDCSFFKELCSFTAYAPLNKNKMFGTNTEKGLDQRGKDVEVSTWFNDASNWVTNGPFKIIGINNKQTGTFDLVKNNDSDKECTTGDKYETKPSKIYYHLIDDDSAMYMDYQRNRYDMIDSFPTAMTDKIKTELKDEYRVANQIGNYYFFFNVNDNALDITNVESEEKKEHRRTLLRKGLVRLVNRLDMVDTIVKSGATDGNGFVSKDITESVIPGKSGTDDYEGLWCKRYKKGDPTIEFDPDTDFAAINDFELATSDWHDRNLDMSSHWDTNDYTNYWLGKRDKGGFWKSTEDEDVKSIPETDSLARQKKIMEGNNGNVAKGLKFIKEGIKDISDNNIKFNEDTGKFENFPTLTITTNTGTGHESLCERLQYLYGLYGITLKIETQEWTAFSSYIREGNVSMARNGWIADFSDARTYLELFTSTGSSNYCQLGKTASNNAYIHKSQ